ncbi:MAG TPA: ABC transporter substrate-binding protein [Caproicibacter sp.]|nr:ABC transporter substrate-binding protein [Caproicibacter sp.]
MICAWNERAIFANVGGTAGKLIQLLSLYIQGQELFVFPGKIERVMPMTDGWWRKPEMRNNTFKIYGRKPIMKSVMKKLIAVGMAAAMISTAAGCSSSGSSSAAASGSSNSSDKKVTVGVIQYATHPSLNNCYTGFKEGLKEAGYEEGKNLTVDFQNAQADNSNSDLMAKNMVSKKYDMIMTIATPSAMSAFSAAKSTNIPVVFTAVSDPVAAQLVTSLQKPGSNCTGSSDVLPLEAQLKMIRAYLPKAKKIGVLYTTSEVNSVSTLKTFKELAPKYNFEVADVGITNSSEVASGAASLVAKGVDCVNNFTDNNVVNNLSTLLQATDKAKIPVFGSEVEQVKNGCLAAQSIDYVALGKETGKMAAKILKGEAKASDTPVYVVSEGKPVYNKSILEKFSLTLPSSYSNAEAVTASK